MDWPDLSNLRVVPLQPNHQINRIPKAFISVAEFKDCVGIGKTFFYEQVALGNIKTVKVGRRTLIPVAEIQAFVKRIAKARGSRR